ncbi:hypothetical protein Esti_002369 [Eimeria stiedai]
MWYRAMHLHFVACKDLESGRALMLKALRRLPRRKHIKFVCACARLEYLHGSPERGQTYYEKLLSENPKRTDVWSLYLDQHVSLHTPPRCVPANLETVRLVFKRAVSLPLKPHKMKAIFSKWLTTEKRFGSPDSQQHVQQEARAYVLRCEAQLLKSS